MRKILFLLGFFVFAVAGLCRAQVVVKGTVQDSTGRPLPTVSVYATGLDSTSIRAGTYTDVKGRFKLQLKLNQPYLLHIRSLGYQQKVLNIPAYSTPHTIDTTIVLHRKVEQMKTLVVQAKSK